MKRELAAAILLFAWPALADVLAVNPGQSTNVAATGSSVAGTIVMSVGMNAMHIANTSATLGCAARIGVGAQTAVLTTDIMLPPMSHVVIAASPLVTGAAAICTGAGPTVVMFTPARVN